MSVRAFFIGLSYDVWIVGVRSTAIQITAATSAEGTAGAGVGSLNCCRMDLDGANFKFDIGNGRFFKHIVDFRNQRIFGKLKMMNPCRTADMDNENRLFVGGRPGLIG